MKMYILVGAALAAIFAAKAAPTVAPYYSSYFVPTAVPLYFNRWSTFQVVITERT